MTSRRPSDELGGDGVVAHVGAGRLQDDRCHVVVLGQGLLHQRYVVGRQHDHRAEGLIRDAPEHRVAGHGVVVPSMEVVHELDDLRLARVGPHQSERHEGRLGARALEAHLLDAGHEVDHRLPPPYLQVRRRAEVRSHGHLSGDRLDDVGMGVAQDQRAVAGVVVDQPVAVHVPLVRPKPVGGIDRERLEAAGVVGHTVGKQAPGRRVPLGRPRMHVDVLLLDRGYHASTSSASWVTVAYYSPTPAIRNHTEQPP